MKRLYQRLFGTKTKATLSRKASPRAFQPQFETLEERALLAASVINGALNIKGTNKADAIGLQNSLNDPSKLQVLVNGRQQFQGPWAAITRGITLDGRKGDDNISVEHIARFVQVSVLGNVGNDVINVSPVDQNLGTIAGSLSVDGGAGIDTLNTSDRNNPLASETYITSTDINKGGGSTIAYRGIENLVIQGSNVRDTFYVSTTAFGTTTTVYGNSGTDRMLVGDFDDLALAGIAGPLKFDGGADLDTLEADDYQNPYAETYTLTASTLTRSNWASSLTYSAVEALELQTANERGFGVEGSTINIASIAAGMDVTVRTSAGPDGEVYRNTINVGNTTNTMGDIRGRLFLNTVPGDVVNLHDEGMTTGQSYTLSYLDGSVQFGRAYATIVSIQSYDAFDGQTLTLNAGGGHDWLRLMSVIPELDVRFHAGNGIDSLDYGQYDPEYAERNRGVTVNLKDNMADGFRNGISGGISGIEWVYGTVKDDILIGDAGSNYLFGNEGNDVMVGMAANDELMGGDGRDLVIGGEGIDDLHGYRGEDIIIGGTTPYDTDVAALQSLMQNWGRTDMDYTARVRFLNSDLLIFIPKLTHQNVKNDYAVDVMKGGEDLDWFFSSDIAGELKDRDYYNEFCMSVS